MIGLADFPISALLSSAASRTAYSRRSDGMSSRDSGSPLEVALSDLVAGIEVEDKRISGNGGITCLITDSRRVVPGALFFAIGGAKTDGNYYVEEAVDRGACAVITESDLGSHFPIDFIRVKDVRLALAIIAKRFYEEPDERLDVAGVTGTNGKTTVTMLAQHLIGGSDRVGLVGTVRYDLGRRSLPSFRTTPESVDIYALLSQMEVNACKQVVMEVSSHGIDQKRTHGLAVDVAAFLNLTQDHIDYHGSMEEYYQVKRRLFNGEMGECPKTAVINADCPYGKRLISELEDEGPKLITFAIDDDADIAASDIRLGSSGADFLLRWPGGQSVVNSPLLGRYNVSNLLAALAIAYAHGYDLNTCLDRVSDFSGVPGRMERIDEGQSCNVVIDYAHTDDALTNATQMLHEITAGRVITVFGCGGDRDRMKRAPMTQAVIDQADVAIATADNPRTESLEQIFDDMREAVGSDGIEFIDDRKDAISRALDLAGPEDCVLIAGKGHESFQECNGTVVPFDDRLVARELIRLKQT